MNLTLDKLKIRFDYVTVAFVCTAIILCGDSRYIIAAVCTLLHELGHIAVMLGLGCESISVDINLFNVAISDRQRGVRPYIQDIAIICAGPSVNFLMFGICLLLNSLVPSKILYNVAMISLALGLFNLLPIESTDGGQLLQIALCRFFSITTAQRIMTILSVLFIIPIACGGFYVLLNSRYNYTMLFASLYLAVVVIMKCSKTV